MDHDNKSMEEMHDDVDQVEVEDEVSHFSSDESNDAMLTKVFSTLDAAFEFYNQHVLLKGFGVRRSFSNKKKGEVYRTRFVCNKEGFKDMKDKRWNDASFRRRETRTGCQAKFQVRLSKNGVWIVELFNDVLNHDLTETPSKKGKHRSHRLLHRSDTCRSFVSTLSKKGLRPSQIQKFIEAVNDNEGEVTARHVSEIVRDERII